MLKFKRILISMKSQQIRCIQPLNQHHQMGFLLFLKFTIKSSLFLYLSKKIIINK